MTSCCWWCCHSIDNEPLHLPYKYDDRRDKFYTMGHFCSWSCMKAFNIDHFPQHKSGIYGINMTLMKKKCDKKTEPIKLAPSRYLLKTFGGPLTIEEFRDGSTKIIKYPTDNIIFTNVEIQRIDKPEEAEHCVKHKLNEIQNAKQQNQPLKLKREKPLKRNKNNLESIFSKKS